MLADLGKVAGHELEAGGGKVEVPVGGADDTGLGQAGVLADIGEVVGHEVEAGGGKVDVPVGGVDDT